ncbi:MAG: hypothetical protein LC792_01715, partial [Actinobacteria bacterium]|nr:hypothetical protein [Actinomycetota bacterium]
WGSPHGLRPVVRRSPTTNPAGGRTGLPRLPLPSLTAALLSLRPDERRAPLTSGGAPPTQREIPASGANRT